MKILKLSLALLCFGGLLVACDYESFEDESGLSNLQFENQFVRLLTGGVDGEAEITVSELDTTATVTIQSQETVEGEVTVRYDLGGTAEYGEIYTIDGASASGGSVTLPFQDGESIAFAEGDVEIMFLVDSIENAPLTIEFTLAEATSTSGRPLNVGQGSLRRTATLTLVND